MNWFEDLFIDEAKNALNKHQGGGGSGGSGGPSAKPDYNQNDPNASDYIKNRPFYTGDPEKVVLYDGEVGAGESELLDDGTRVYFSNMDYYAPGLDFVIDQQYTVVFDGVTYDITAWDFDGFGVIGSRSIWNYESYDDSQPPFCIGDGWFVSVSDNFSDNYTYPIKISTVQSKINPIDIKYIPDMYGMVGPVKLTGGDYFEVWPEDTDYVPFYNLYYDFHIVENGEYKVTWNGTEYLCIAQRDYAEGLCYIGNPRYFAMGDESYPDNGMPFMFVELFDDEGIMLIAPNPTDVCVWDYFIETEQLVPRKIPDEYMPDMVIEEFENIRWDINNLYNNSNSMSKSNPIGTGSFSMNRKSGTDSTKGSYSHTEGRDSQATTDLNEVPTNRSLGADMYGYAAHAEGCYTVAVGAASHSEGLSTYAKGYYSHAEGSNTDAIGMASHAEGNINTASGNYSHAEGSDNTASGEHSHAEGWSTTASGKASHAEGHSATASGENSHAEGNTTKASGQYSHAEGNGTTASGNKSHAEGHFTFAVGVASHSEGDNTKAVGDYSHAEGNYVSAESAYQHVQGKHNVVDADNTYAHIVGNGENASTASNAHTLDWSGNATFAGSVNGPGADYAEYFEWVDGNPTNEDRIGTIVTLEGDKIRPANADDEILGIVTGTAMVIGDNAEWEWRQKYLVDDYGRVITEMVEEFYDTVNEETGETEKVSCGFFPHRKLNPDFDPNKEYERRCDRPEWDTVGLFGKIHVTDDGTCVVGSYAAVSENGIATASTEKTNMRVMKRISDTVILVFMK